MIYFILFIDIVLTVTAQLLLRVGAQRLPGEFSLALILAVLRNWYLLGGVVLFGTAFFLYVFVLSRLQLNMVYPVATGTTLILITTFSYFFLHEAITARQIAGIGAIAAGIFFVMMPK
jgi:multidrug transporter EmrE-like cation transporter